MINLWRKIWNRISNFNQWKPAFTKELTLKLQGYLIDLDLTHIKSINTIAPKLLTLKIPCQTEITCFHSNCQTKCEQRKKEKSFREICFHLVLCTRKKVRIWCFLFFLCSLDNRFGKTTIEIFSDEFRFQD